MKECYIIPIIVMQMFQFNLQFNPQQKNQSIFLPYLILDQCNYQIEISHIVVLTITIITILLIMESIKSILIRLEFIVITLQLLV